MGCGVVSELVLQKLDHENICRLLGMVCVVTLICILFILMISVHGTYRALHGQNEQTIGTFRTLIVHRRVLKMYMRFVHCTVSGI